ncbi:MULTISPECIES: methylamine utilization protein MauJ [Roseovarius]|uniref:methylamine utilization protein MauJ n=2 Tax=Roseobacteraceae TaxID=2854170 RepID=UPI00273DB89A|nr:MULTISPECIES: methylamine utilization protein MauJ [unclassified Roseovarius]
MQLGLLMECVAHYEIMSDVSIISDDHVLTITDPAGAFKARVKNIPRTEFTTPFLLSLQIYFEAPDLEAAKESVDEVMAHCLNMLAFTTGAGFRKHRIRKIIDGSNPSEMRMRDALMWSEKVEYDDPQPFLRDENAASIERLLKHDVSPAVKRALRWYRIGVDAASPDDQFTYFWFALEIVAEFNKPTEKVHDQCPHCREPLYCEKCEKHPMHRPYAKQAIRALVQEAAPDSDAGTFELLDKTRNSLMHGSTLEEIEDALPDSEDHVVDVLGRILWKALIMQFPKELFKEQVVMGTPETYVHYKMNMVAKVQTVFPADQDGYYDLDSNSITVEMKPSGPPQSALPSVVRMTKEQYGTLCKLSYGKSEQREMLERLRSHAQEHEGHILVQVLSTDKTTIDQAIDKKEDGEWQNLFREIINPAEDNGSN